VRRPAPAWPVARTVLLTLVLGAGPASARTNALPAATSATAKAARRADAPASRAHRRVGPAVAPSGPPLAAGASEVANGSPGEDAGAPPGVEADPLVSNGLGSPLCRGLIGGGELPAASRRNCETSGFVAAAAPTGNYGIDVHIDTGLLGLNTGGALSAVQDLLVTPLWTVLVWAVHAIVVMVEWCFAIDLLDSAGVGGIGSGLREMQATLTEPWLAIVLAVASVLALYNGLIRRRVAETVGQALLMVAMIVGGMWVIADPTGTVGSLGRWANQASLGTLAVAARGTPAGAGGALARSMDTVFAATIEAPWCFLEFGNVGWCRDPARLDPRLRAAATRIAAADLSLVGCNQVPDLPSPCISAGSTQAKAVEHSAQLLRSAQTNGAIFLALPANGPSRNSINEASSLLRTLCQSSQATICRGPTAAQAEFRTGSGTWPRLGGLLLIGMGALGMMLLLGFIALRLLGAAIFSLLYLLLAPGMVLAPALGEGGRALFRKWLAHLLGAVVSKLLFSFLLGIVLAVLAILSSLRIGWWMQWLLMSAFWWGTYARRHQALGLAQGAAGREHLPRRPSPVRRASEALETSRRAIAAGRWAKSKLTGNSASEEQREGVARVGRERAKTRADEQVARTLRSEHADARTRMQTAARSRESVSRDRAQLERVRVEQARALAGGDTCRAAELGNRGERIESRIAQAEGALTEARRVAGDGQRAERRGERPFGQERVQEQERFLDAQAELAPASRARGRSRVGGGSLERRDYAALAGLAGYLRQEYERLGPGPQRAARLQIDRELAVRGKLGETAETVAADAAPPGLGRRATRRATGEFDSALSQRMRDDGQRMPASSAPRSQLDAWRERGQGARARDVASESSVMRDARELAARRQRQMGGSQR
jgi:hypothetical protein